MPSGASGLNAIVDSNLASNETINGTSSADYIEIQDSANSNVGSVSGNNGDDIIYIKGWGSSRNSSVDGGGGSDTLVINPDIFSSKSNWTNNGGIKSGTIHFTTGGSITINNFETVRGIWGSASSFERKVSVKADFGSQNLSDITVSSLPGGTSVYDSDGNGVSTVNDGFTVGSVVSGQEQIFTLRKNGPFDFTLNASITDTDTSNIYTTSALIDGIVVGVEYTTSSGLKGLTDQEGNFSHIIGDDVTFNIGGVVLGTATADDLSKGRVFLQDIADVDRTTLNNIYLENMATFLQSLDDNNDAYDNIVISQAIRDALTHESLDLRTASEEEVEQLINKVGGILVEEADAMTHVKDMLIKYSDLTQADFEDEASFSSSDILVDTIDTDLLVNEYKSEDSPLDDAELVGVPAIDLDLSNLLDMPGDEIVSIASDSEASSETLDEVTANKEDETENEEGGVEANAISSLSVAPIEFIDNLIGEVNQAGEV